MDVFDEFKSIKKEYTDIMINRFNDAPFAENFKCIFDVIEYIYEGIEDGEDPDDDIYDLYTFGYRYLNEKFLYINSFLSNIYKNDAEFKEHYDEIDMLFYIMDFITDAELDNLKTDKLTNIQEEVFKLIEMKKPISPSTNERLDQISKEIFKNGYHSFYETFDTLYEAITYGIDEEVDDDEDDTYYIDK